MKSQQLIRIHRFQVDEKRRAVAQIETMIADFNRKIAELDQQIELEQNRSGISDVTHFAYPTFARAAIVRKENLQTSIDALVSQLDAAKDDLADAFAELKRLELMAERESVRLRSARLAQEQMTMDEVALGMHRQRGHRA